MQPDRRQDERRACDLINPFLYLIDCPERRNRIFAINRRCRMNLWDRRRQALSMPASEGDSELEEAIEREITQLRQAEDRHAGGTCSECGARYPEGGLFCPQCGTKVG